MIFDRTTKMLFKVCLAAVLLACATAAKGPKVTNKVFFDVEIGGKPVSDIGSSSKPSGR